MATIIRMPGVLAGAEEAALAGWLVAVGDTVSVGDPIAEIETEKATVEYAAEASGIMARTLINAGDSSDVGAAIAVLLAEGETEADIDAVLAGGIGTNADVVERDPDSAAPVIEAPSLKAAGQAAAEGKTAGGEVEAEPAPPEAETNAPDDAGDVPAPSGAAGSRVFASPIARRLARERDVDLAAVAATGPGGRISRRDLEVHEAAAASSKTATAETGVTSPATTVPAAASVAPAAPASPSTSGAWDEVPHTGMRKAIARRLTESKSTVPHFYLTADCRVDALLALRAQINESSPVRISVNDLVVKAVAVAFADVPDANVTWTDTALRRHRTVDIAVAVATDGGLFTPVLRDVGSQSVSAISTSITELAGRARERKLRQDELEGGAFSVTNLGMYGTLEFAAILNPPQSGILAVGAARKQPVVDDKGELAVASVMRCTLSVDHRAVDGALAAQWLAAFTKRIENPLSILV
ncbi:MAG: pyruvate dehydrogenase complex dihydrolipoamide acetyltransferase [Pseudonocardiales bacterium]|nr:pyruvate dehydrogenase complex dihydrolipoamide acetyltransferase [Pseudonocardiales bacterium]